MGLFCKGFYIFLIECHLPEENCSGPSRAEFKACNNQGDIKNHIQHNRNKASIIRDNFQIYPSEHGKIGSFFSGNFLKNQGELAALGHHTFFYKLFLLQFFFRWEEEPWYN